MLYRIVINELLKRKYWTYWTFIGHAKLVEVIFMEFKDFCKGIYDSVGRKRFVNHAHFITILFKAGGSEYFVEEPTRKYSSDAYQYKIFNGSKPISQIMKATFPSPIDKNNLFQFFLEYIDDSNEVTIINYFDIQTNDYIDVECICRALAEQFILFITSVDDEVNDVISDVYKEEICYIDSKKNFLNEKKAYQQTWKYNIVLLDDMEEQLDMLKEEMNTLFDNEPRYSVRVFPCQSSVEVINKSHNMDVDVYVLDVARKPSKKWQTKELDYFGRDLYEQLITEKPNILVKSKFYIFSRLPMAAIRKEFDGVDVMYFQKQKYSIAEMARTVKAYIDVLFERESSSLKSYLDEN